jgi:hypothetical protein
MKRDEYKLDVLDSEWVEDDGDPTRPNLAIGVGDTFDALSDRLRDPDGDLLGGSDVDLSFRYRSDDTGVLSLANRATGEYILELNAPDREVLQFVRAARRYSEAADDAGYAVALHRDGDEVVTYEKDTFLVYDPDGNLRREDSLIPGGVEL